jgi:hypothetical protein
MAYLKFTQFKISNPSLQIKLIGQSDNSNYELKTKYHFSKILFQYIISSNVFTPFISKMHCLKTKS